MRRAQRLCSAGSGLGSLLGLGLNAWTGGPNGGETCAERPRGRESGAETCEEVEREDAARLSIPTIQRRSERRPAEPG